MSTDHYWVVPGKTDAERWRDQFYEADQGRADANAEAMQLLQRGNTYRRRALALIKQGRMWRSIGRVSQAGAPAITEAVYLAAEYRKKWIAANARAERLEAAVRHFFTTVPGYVDYYKAKDEMRAALAGQADGGGQGE